MLLGLETLAKRLKDLHLFLFSIGKKEKTDGKTILVENSSSDENNENEAINVARKMNFSSRTNIGESNVDKSNRKKPIVDDQSILEDSDQLVVDESIEVDEEEVDIAKGKKTRSLGDSKSVTFLDNADDEKDVTSLMEAHGKPVVSSSDKNVS